MVLNLIPFINCVEAAAPFNPCPNISIEIFQMIKSVAVWEMLSREVFLSGSLQNNLKYSAYKWHKILLFPRIPQQVFAFGVQAYLWFREGGGASCPAEPATVLDVKHS